MPITSSTFPSLRLSMNFKIYSPLRKNLLQIFRHPLDQHEDDENYQYYSENR